MNRIARDMDGERAMGVIHREIAEYTFPPSEANISAAEKIADRAFNCGLLSALLMLVITGFFVFYHFHPGEAFRMVAKATLGLLVMSWVVSLIAIKHFHQRYRLASAAWEWMRARCPQKASDQGSPS